MTNEHVKDYVVWATRDEHRDDDAMVPIALTELSRYDTPALRADVEMCQQAMSAMHGRRCVVLPDDMERYADYRFVSPASERPTHKLTVGTVVEGIARWAVRAAIKKIDRR